ncbi:MAG TPA: dehydrogenase, partial [Planctomycetota bacterium]|nr:dehydrogenase [Planctomycetota bacterium]
AATAPMLAVLDMPGFWDRTMVREHLLPRLARRYAIEGKRQDLLVCAELFGKAPTADHAKKLLAGFEEAYRGRPMAGLPEELLATLRRAGELPLIFRLKLGEESAVGEAIRRLGDAKAKPEERALYARALGERRAPEAVAPLLAAAGPGPEELRKAALGALSAYDEDSVGDRVAEMLPTLDGDVRTSAFGLLASRARWSGRLLDAVEGGRLKRASVPDDVATRLRGSEDTELRARAERLLPSSPPEAGAFRERMEAVEKALKAGSGNPYAGEAIFMARCANCHTLFHKGGKVGPDLTTYQRDNLGTMLLSIVNPSAEIREGFQYYLVATTDDRVLSGFFVDRDTQVVVLRMLDGETVSLRTSQVRAIKPTGQSLMPPGLLDGLSDEQLRDFFAYLRIKQPISK